MKHILKSAVSVIVLASVLSGCTMSEAPLQVSETTRVANRLKGISERPAAPANLSQVQVNPSAYVGAEVSRNDRGDPLPSKWHRQDVSFARAAPATFQEVAHTITSTTGIPVAVDVGGVPTNAAAGAAAAAAVPAGGAPATGMPYGADDLASAISGVALAVGEPADLGITGTMKLSYKGRLEGFLDLVAANYNIGWEYTDGKIVFMKTITRAFDVPALPIVSDLAFSMDSGGSSSGDAGGTSSSGQSATTKAAFDLWNDLQRTIATVVGSAGTFQMSPQTGQVVVVAPPTVVNRVETYLRDVNQQLAKSIALDVKVFSVTLRDSTDAQSNLMGMLRNAGSYGLDIDIPQNLALAATQAGNGWAILGSGGDTDGLLFQYLQSKGDTSVATSASVTTLNGQPVPVQVAQTRGYLAKTSVTANDENQTTELEPGSVTTGFNLHLVPKVQRDGTVMLQYGMNISELVGSQDGFEVFESGDQRIQLPNIAQRNFIQQAMIPNGKTLVLSGFEQVRATSSERGPLSSVLWPLGGSRNNAVTREMIVVAITPTVVDLSGQSATRTAYTGR